MSETLTMCSSKVQNVIDVKLNVYTVIKDLDISHPSVRINSLTLSD